MRVDYTNYNKDGFLAPCIFSITIAKTYFCIEVFGFEVEISCGGN